MATILLIDDERALRSLLRAALEKDHHQVFEAANGRSGLALYRERIIDLVITDVVMPEMNGLDLISELTARCADVKVVAMTGDASRLATAKQLGARQTLQKPFDLDHFLEVVRYELTH
ncbi:MAG TPA: response regulator [Nitrospira sp.]|nr:response regulator [Nitrospira sp.]